jgi:TolB-like protein/tetratricopeptide (TPR) repeat protein
MSNQAPGYQRFFAELKRRRVFRVMAVYGAVAFVVLQLADIALPGLGLPDWTMNLILLLALLGFPFAVVLAWAFEVTPEGVRRTEEATPGELAEILAAPAAKRWPSGVLALAGMTALLAGTWYIGRQSVAPATTESGAMVAEASIAVLPFVNMSADPDQEYFSDGISEELLNLLAKIPELRVASRTSAFSFKGETLEIPEIARRLDVAHVLEGSVRKAGSEVRITAQLIDARSDTHLWSETWDRTLEDIFAVQDEIAADVVDQLKITLLGEAPHVEQADPEAYALFLQARQVRRQITPEASERSNELLEQALAIDPDYAPAWTELAGNYYRQSGQGWLPVAEGFRMAREAAERALEIDPEYAPAYAVLGRIADSYDNDLAAAVRQTERALELAPNDPEIHKQAATLAANLGRVNESTALLESAVVRDPVNSGLRHNLGLRYLWVGKWDEAITQFRTELDLTPGSGGAHSDLGLALLGNGDSEHALEEIEQEPDEFWRLLALVMAYHALGRDAESDAVLSELVEKYEREGPYNIAYALAYRGESDRAFEWLAKAVEYADPGLSEIQSQPLFANIRDDPRWLPFVESIGRSPAQLAAIEFEVTLPQ